MELAFSFLFPFCPHYLLLTSLLLVLCFSSAWRHSTAALPPPAVGGGEGLPDAQASQDGEGEEAGGRYQGETAFLSTSTYSLSWLSDPVYVLDMQDMQQLLNTLQQPNSLRKEIVTLKV